MSDSHTKWTSNSIPFARNWPLHIMIGVFVIYSVWMAISPTDRMQWYANNLPLIALILLLAFTYKRYRFSNLSYFLMLIFFCLHVYAGHFTYEATPFDHWLKRILHTKRSYYDRIVHFGFGLLIFYPLREFLDRCMTYRRIWSFALPVIFVSCFSGVLEIVEWLAAEAFGQGGEAEFIGMQGDMFDTQKDMVLGLIGALAAMGAYFFIARNQKHP